MNINLLTQGHKKFFMRGFHSSNKQLISQNLRDLERSLKSGHFGSSAKCLSYVMRFVPTEKQVLSGLLND